MNFDKFVEAYMMLYRQSKNISTAKVKSAVERTATEKKQLVQKLEKMSGNKVIVDYSIDKKLLGGMVVYMDDKVIDGSVKRRLQEIKEVIDR